MSAARHPLKFVVLASGNGTNAKALWNFAQANKHKVQAVGLLCDRKNAGVLEMAKKFAIETVIAEGGSDEIILKALAHWQPDWACLAGYKKLVSKEFLKFFADQTLGFCKVMNIHPSLLPAYPGLRSYERAFGDGVKISGVTVHLVDEGLDTGFPILQEAFAREEEDTFEEFRQHGLTIEHRLFSEALELAADNQVHLKTVHGHRFISLQEIL